MVHFILYSRSYCHLCEDMLEALYALDGEFEFDVDVKDVDADEALVAQYDELVPVLVGTRVGMPEVQLCHYFLDQIKVREFLAAARLQA